MWIQVIGASGSGKTLIVENLQKNGYELIGQLVPEVVGDAFFRELTLSQARLKSQIQASEVMNRKDVVTVRSFWDSHEVFIPSTHHFQEISDYERSIFEQIYQPLVDTRALIPPHAVVYMKMPQMSAYNRMALRNVDINPDRYNHQAKLYEAYVERIAAPVLEIDGEQTPDLILKQLEFDLSSIKATVGSAGNIWQKEYFRGRRDD